MIKILMQNRVDAFDYSGGDTITMMSVKKHLEKQGAKIDISLELEPDLRNYDMVHLFNIIRIHETYAQFRNTKRQNKIVILTPIYWDFSELEEKGRSIGIRYLRRLISNNGIEFIKNIFRIFKDSRQRKALKYQFYKSYTQQQKEVIRGSNIVIPNSLMEANIIKKKFGEYKYRVVYNGVEPEIFLKGDSKRFKKEYNIEFEKFVLCVGRFDPRKNQLNLIRALKGENIPLIFIGNPSPNHFQYFMKCKKEANLMPVKFIPYLSQIELADAYTAAHVHIQPSWLETPGLTNLEAGLTGCNLVLSNRGSVREYFEDLAWYCEPDDLDSIRKATKDAFSKRRGFYTNLKARILERFTWGKSANDTLNIYKKILEKNYDTKL